MEAPARKPVRVGMAGVLWYSPDRCRDAAQEVAISACFEDSARTSRTEWRGSNIYALTLEHVDEIEWHGEESFCTVPSVDGLEGLVFGQHFAKASLTNKTSLSRSVVGSFHREGVSAFQRLNGAWAGVFWDRARQEASLVRDRLGIETLYAKRLPDGIMFCTDLRVFELVGLLGTFDEQAIAEFLHYLYVPAPLTIAQDVHAVLPGRVLRIGGELRQLPYGSPRFVRGTEEAALPKRGEQGSDYVSAFEEHLNTAVGDCVPRVGRIALALSGGKDSSVLAVALSKLCPDRVLAFNVGSRNVRHDETPDAALVAKTLGLPFKSYYPTDRLLADGLRDFLTLQTQPVGDPASLPYFLAMRDLPEDCHIIFDGTGNDYYFGIPSIAKGVHVYGRRLQLERKLPRAAWMLLLRGMSVGPDTLRRLARAWAAPIEESFVAWEGWSQQELSTLFKRDISFAGTYLWRVMREGRDDDWIQLLTNVICGVWEPHTAYRKAFHFAHALGRGIRFPFADDRLAAFVNGLPARLKFHGGENKVLLRAYMARYLPREILAKPKSPFVFDLNLLLANSTYSWVDDLRKRDLLRLLPGWRNETLHLLLAQYGRDPHDTKWQCRLYALCLLASVASMRRGLSSASTQADDAKGGLDPHS